MKAGGRPPKARFRRARSGGRGFLSWPAVAQRQRAGRMNGLRARAGRSVVLDPIALAFGRAFGSIPAGCDCLIRTASLSADIERVGKWAREQALSSGRGRAENRLCSCTTRLAGREAMSARRDSSSPAERHPVPSAARSNSARWKSAATSNRVYRSAFRLAVLAHRWCSRAAISAAPGFYGRAIDAIKQI